MDYAEYGQYVHRTAVPDDVGRVTGIDFVSERVRVHFDQGDEWLTLAELVPFAPQRALDAEIARIREATAAVGTVVPEGDKNV